MRCPNHRTGGKGDAYDLQELPSRGDRADLRPRLSAQRDARMAPAVRQASFVNRLA
jgi:hypothetical protein